MGFVNGRVRMIDVVGSSHPRLVRSSFVQWRTKPSDSVQRSGIKGFVSTALDAEPFLLFAIRNSERILTIYPHIKVTIRDSYLFRKQLTDTGPAMMMICSDHFKTLFYN